MLRIILWVVLIGAMSCGGYKTSRSGNGGLTKGCGTPLECELINKTNVIRQQNGVGLLGARPECVAMAEDQSSYMANGGVFAHDRPGETFQQRASRFGCWGGENIAYGSSTVDGTLNQWMNSAGHRANILDSGFETMGAGENRGFWTQCFSY